MESGRSPVGGTYVARHNCITCTAHSINVGMRLWISLHEPSRRMPTLTSLTPGIATAGDPAFTLTVNGSGFGTDTVVFLERRQRSLRRYATMRPK